MRAINKVLLLICTLFFIPDAGAEIYRCTDENGNMVFSQVPCAEEEAPAAEEETDEAPEAEPTAGDNIDVVTDVHDSAAVAQCKKPYRDAIEAIEARMLDGYSPEQAEAYKKQLLGLTKGLRSCES